MTYSVSNRQRSPQISNTETVFNAKDVFFSVTDTKGIILQGNDTFFRLAEYEEHEVLGKPHNIIRHPWMPKAAFKVVWSYLLAGKDVVAYVVNRTRTGKYYWVFAYVSPIWNEAGEISSYLSVRIKPSSTLFPVVKGLYQKTLEVEQESGMDGGLEFLVSALNQAGYASYDDFMQDAVRSELSGTNLGASVLEHIKIGSFLSKGTLGRLHYELSGTLIAQNLGVQASLRIGKAKEAIQGLIDETNIFFASIKDSSINMAICAGKLTGSSARSLRPVAFEMISMANKGAKMTEPLNQTLHELLENFEHLCFSVGKNYIYSSSVLNEIDLFLQTKTTLDEHMKAYLPIVSKTLENTLKETEEHVANTQKQFNVLLSLTKKKMTDFMMKIFFLCMQGLVQAQAWDANDVINTLSELQARTSQFEQSLDGVLDHFQEIEEILDLIIKAMTQSKIADQYLVVASLES